MTAFAAFTLEDASSQPVAFNPQSTKDGISKWFDTNTVYDAKRAITMSLTLPKNGSTVIRSKMKVVIPIMDTIDVSKKVGEAYANIEFVLPKSSALVVREDLRRFAENLLGTAVVTAAVSNFESVY